MNTASSSINLPAGVGIAAPRVSTRLMVALGGAGLFSLLACIAFYLFEVERLTDRQLAAIAHHAGQTMRAADLDWRRLAATTPEGTNRVTLGWAFDANTATLQRTAEAGAPTGRLRFPLDDAWLASKSGPDMRLFVVHGERVLASSLGEAGAGEASALEPRIVGRLSRNDNLFVQVPQRWDDRPDAPCAFPRLPRPADRPHQPRRTARRPRAHARRKPAQPEPDGRVQPRSRPLQGDQRFARPRRRRPRPARDGATAPHQRARQRLRRSARWRRVRRRGRRVVRPEPGGTDRTQDHRTGRYAHSAHRPTTAYGLLDRYRAASGRRRHARRADQAGRPGDVRGQAERARQFPLLRREPRAQGGPTPVARDSPARSRDERAVRPPLPAGDDRWRTAPPRRF